MLGGVREINEARGDIIRRGEILKKIRRMAKTREEKGFDDRKMRNEWPLSRRMANPTDY